MKSLNLISLLLIINADISAQNQSNVEEQIKQCIYSFVNAGDERNSQALDTILNENSRVVANRFPTPDKTTILSKENYIQMLTAGKIGGIKREIKILEIDILSHIAITEIEMTSSKTKFITYISLILNTDNKWQIINDMPYVENK